MASSFKFLSMAEFRALDSTEQLAYLSDAMQELDRAKIPRDERRWENLFAQSAPEEPKAD